MIYEKVLEIIVFLLAELKKNKQLSEVDLKQLEKQGYTENEINTAFSWVYSKIYTGDKIFADEDNNIKSNRFLHEVEQNIISSEAYGYLIQLKELGLLNNMDVDLIIDKLMVTSYNKVDLVDMKYMIAAYLLDIDDMNNTNSRMMINTDDTIN
jgi:uncharacterized protein Smg (DUF494 family)